ncbi:hypothetical protein EG328_010713 [Venturia inaequalis]|uniref:Uncharacterized protein n=1 Tax=Venturia inaequalis TaxID=5025 RepID=A0A8H3YKU9_VENIN|nr:hypothetical protein EG328_010713 [Venturia inaequalis]
MVELGQMVQALGVFVKPTGRKDNIIAAIVSYYIKRLKEDFAKLGAPPKETDTNVEENKDGDPKIVFELKKPSSLVEAPTAKEDHAVAATTNEDNIKQTNRISRRDDKRLDYDYRANRKYYSRKFGDTEFFTGDYNNLDHPARKHKSRNHRSYDQVDDYYSYNQVEDHRHHQRRGHGHAQYTSANAYNKFKIPDGLYRY